jgi:hypothetical protein
VGGARLHHTRVRHSVDHEAVSVFILFFKNFFNRIIF